MRNGLRVSSTTASSSTPVPCRPSTWVAERGLHESHNIAANSDGKGGGDLRRSRSTFDDGLCGLPADELAALACGDLS